MTEIIVATVAAFVIGWIMGHNHAWSRAADDVAFNGEFVRGLERLRASQSLARKCVGPDAKVSRWFDMTYRGTRYKATLSEWEDA